MLHRALFAVLFMMLVGGCSLEQELSRTPRTAVEQVLLTQAVTRALKPDRAVACRRQYRTGCDGS